MFRKATENDIESVTEIYRLIHDEEEAGRASIGWKREIYPTKETAKEALKSGDLFVLEEEGIVVASARINQNQVNEYALADWEYPASDAEIMVLHTLTVSPKHSGKGYGRQFVSFYEDFAKKHGCRYLRIDTNEKNEKARKFYRKLGYKEVGIVPCVFNGIENVQLVCIEKKL